MSDPVALAESLAALEGRRNVGVPDIRIISPTKERKKKTSRDLPLSPEQQSEWDVIAGAGNCIGFEEFKKAFEIPELAALGSPPGSPVKARKSRAIVQKAQEKENIEPLKRDYNSPSVGRRSTGLEYSKGTEADGISAFAKVSVKGADKDDVATDIDERHQHSFQPKPLILCEKQKNIIPLLGEIADDYDPFDLDYLDDDEDPAPPAEFSMAASNSLERIAALMEALTSEPETQAELQARYAKGGKSASSSSIAF
ncbi:hypothetical protein BT69DRAFT_1346227 [Atractiella rhizophila]|nr:hypothetical protein BT69DRAFT_1346227 [Atractiella rhizophila]